jgi:hypothetical protein
VVGAEVNGEEDAGSLFDIQYEIRCLIALCRARAITAHAAHWPLRSIEQSTALDRIRDAKSATAKLNHDVTTRLSLSNRIETENDQLMIHQLIDQMRPHCD